MCLDIWVQSCDKTIGSGSCVMMHQPECKQLALCMARLGACLRSFIAGGQHPFAPSGAQGVSLNFHVASKPCGEKQVQS